MMSPSATGSVRLPTSTRYEFQRPLGSGGRGTVYRALDRRTGQLVAIKVLRARRTEEPALHRRLTEEFQAACGLEHPNIVRALAAEYDGETGYLVYELVDGVSLRSRVEQHGRLTEDVAVRVATQIAQALHYAHSRGVVHRDVNPDNVLLAADGKAKLTGFGLAKDYSTPPRDPAAADPRRRRDRSRTPEPDPAPDLGGADIPHFVAPEQFAARTDDPRSDVYSLATTLYYALTGRLPFDSKSIQSIRAKKENFRMPAVRPLGAGLSDRVDAAIRASVDPHPDRRPASCLEFFKLLTGRRRHKEDSNVTPAPKLTATAAAEERRAWVRFPFRVGSYAVVDPDVHHGGPEEVWPLVVRDVSAGGIAVLLARRFEPGTDLFIELWAGAGGQPRRLPARVVRVQAERAGHWIHGCSFDTPLAEAELAALLRLA
jgi:serine/threonine protein kinase